MFEVLDLIQGSENWLSFRREKVTATDAAKILRLVPPKWGNPYSLWIKKLSGEEDEITPAMQRGMDLEDEARELYSKTIGEPFSPLVAESTKYPWLMASLDAVSEDYSKGAEIKCPGIKTHALAEMGKVPDYYFPQLQVQMLVTGWKEIDYFSYDGRNGIIITVKRDDDYIKFMIPKLYEFYECLINCKQPDLLDHEYEIITDDYLLFMSRELQELNKQKKCIESQICKYKEEISSKINCKSAIIGDLKIRYVSKKGNIDYKSIPQLEQLDLEQYRSKPITYQTFLFK